MIAVDLRHRLGAFALDARFASAGRLTALFGQSGSGKTSLVNLVGGLMRPDAGRIAVDNRVLVDTEKRIFVPKHRRRLGYVFQDARLFPHLTVRKNLGYGRWFTPAAERYQSFDDVVDLLGLGHLLERQPARLSGGERQRVAIGRALLASPRLLLMDEPLAALDKARKAEVLPYIERLRDGMDVPILYVTHSIAEVLRLAAHLVVLKDGRVVEEGDPVEIAGRLDLAPAVADVEPGSIIDTRIAGHDDRYGLTALALRAGTLHVPRLQAAIGTPVRIRLRARDVMIALSPPENLSALNVLAGTITAIADDRRSHADLTLDCNGDALLARITRRSVADLGLIPGARVFAIVKTVSFERTGRGPAGPLVAL
jgi:molybdate transport system ATP-binding protein